MVPADPEARARIRAALEVPEDRVVVTVVSRLVRHKGYPELVAAMRRVARCRALGRGRTADHRSRCRIWSRYSPNSGLGGRLRMLGYRADVPAVLAASDIFALPSHFEGLPMSVIEAMLTGLPVVATNIRGPSEQVIDGETGLWSRPMTVRPLAEALLRLAADFELRSKMGAAGTVQGDGPLRREARGWADAGPTRIVGLCRAAGNRTGNILMTDIAPIRRALISVSNKTDIELLASALAQRGVEILSTGGSATALRRSRHSGQGSFSAYRVSGDPGRPGEDTDAADPRRHPGTRGTSAEHLQRDAGARNRADRPGRGQSLSVRSDGDEGRRLRTMRREHRRGRAGAHTRCGEEPRSGHRYDGPVAIRRGSRRICAIRRHHARVSGASSRVRPLHAQRPTIRRSPCGSPGRMAMDFHRVSASLAYCRQTLRYGENPHQRAAFYVTEPRFGIATAVQVQGKELSYNNLNDTDAAFECVAEFKAPAVVIVKHANPCGVAMRAFGGGGLGSGTALRSALGLWRGRGAEPETGCGGSGEDCRDFHGGDRRAGCGRRRKDDARGQKEPSPVADERLARSVRARDRHPQRLRRILAQTRDAGQPAVQELEVVTERAPNEAEWADLLFAFRVCKHVKSNAIVYAKGGATVGIGAGQMSCVDSARIAAWKSAEAAKAAGLDAPLTEGSVVASDAFFPFADGLQAAIAAGATAVIQPGGSIRDQEVIDAADAAGIAMVFTGMRHFRH